MTIRAQWSDLDEALGPSRAFSAAMATSRRSLRPTGRRWRAALSFRKPPRSCGEKPKSVGAGKTMVASEARHY